MSMQTYTRDDDMMCEINMTPFVDVMLVLLVIFLVTLPFVHQTINIDLPKVTNQRLENPPTPINISVNQEGQYLVNKVFTHLDQLKELLKKESLKNPKPVVLLYADINTRYEHIARVLGSIHQSGLERIGFVTQEESKN